MMSMAANAMQGRGAAMLRREHAGALLD